jgi:hypothetical protein
MASFISSIIDFIDTTFAEFESDHFKLEMSDFTIKIPVAGSKMDATQDPRAGIHLH